MSYLKEAGKNKYFSAPVVVSIKLTDHCIFSCPSCYLLHQNDSKKSIDLQLLKNLLLEMKLLGVRTIALGGGEPTLYHHINETIKFSKELGFRVYLVTSGVGITAKTLKEFSDYNLDLLHVSLNSSIENINNLSRDGYKYAIKAIDTALSVGQKYRINYVAQKNNIPYFDQLIKFAHEYKSDGIDILREKAIYNDKIQKSYNYQDIFSLYCTIKANPNFSILVEECFCELLLLLRKQEKNRSPVIKCVAGKALMAINERGDFLPCPHMQSKNENYNSISDYWSNSPILNHLRLLQLSSYPCSKCIHIGNCSPCQALSFDKRDVYYTSRDKCPLFKETTNDTQINNSQ